jgi:uncharacterized Zn finger protein
MSSKPWPTLTEATVRELARSKSHERGESYYERGAVSNAIRRDETVRADVEGSQYQPYTVRVEFDDAGVAQTDCSCPYDHGGICKHRVAVLLTCLRDPESVQEKPPVAELITDADRETLQEVLVELADSHPEMGDWIETRLSRTEETDAATDISINTESIRQQANHALPKPGQQGHGDAYAEAERMASEINVLITQAQQALDAGDSDTAVDILTTITEVLASNRWVELLPHDVTELYETIRTLGETFTEAMLMADLTESEREEWASQLGDWGNKIRHFTGRPTLSIAADAAREGWDDKQLQQALAGNLDTGELGIDEPMYVDGLTTSRLSVLKRQGRTEEYLNLAKAAGKSQAYTEMLAQAGQIQEAVDTAIGTLSSPQSLLDVAQTLRETGHPKAAVEVAEHGLTIEGHHRDTLAEWLRDRAASMNNDDLALRAAITAFEESPSLTTYQAVQELADDWERVQVELIASLREQKPSSNHAAEVFLHEDLYDDAIEVANRSGRSSVIETVVTAVTESRPQWVISTCKSQAEPIIEQGKHDSYRTAVRWLRRAGEAAQATGELDAWRDYVETVRDDHYQKYKLRPMLEELLEEF